MTIRSRSEKAKKIQIDLAGEQGNAHCLLGIAANIGKQLKKTPEEIQAITAEMTSSDYEHLVATLEKHYGEYIDIYEV